MAREPKTVVLGGSGMLGRSLLRELAGRGEAAIAPSRRELDLNEVESIRQHLAALGPSAVINAAAFTNVAQAEQAAHHAEVYRLNREAPGGLAETCRELQVPLVHLSTDYVFDGRKQQPYREDDPVAPLQVYGHSKLEGEIEVLDRHPEALVVRTSTLFGPGRTERPHYVDAVLRQARETGRLELARLPVSSPTYSLDLARGLLELLRVGAVGLVHLVNAGACSRLELAAETLRLTGLAGRVEVQERPAAEPTARRPDYSVLDTRLYTRLTGDVLRPWQHALRDYLEGTER